MGFKPLPLNYGHLLHHPSSAAQQSHVEKDYVVRPHLLGAGWFLRDPLRQYFNLVETRVFPHGNAATSATQIRSRRSFKEAPNAGSLYTTYWYGMSDKHITHHDGVTDLWRMLLWIAVKAEMYGGTERLKKGDAKGVRSLEGAV